MSTTVKPFAEPAHTQFSNAALDHIMPKVSPAVWKLLSAILRKTKGWHKEWDTLGYSQLEDLTGMARATVAKAVAEALKARYILRVKVGDSYKYKLNQAYEITTSSETEPVQKLNQMSSETEPLAVQKLNTQKKERKHKEKELAPSGAEPIISPSHLMFGALVEATGLDQNLMRGKIGKFSQQILKAGYSPEEVGKYYLPGGWWYAYDWRGKERGQPPTLEQILATLAEARRITNPPAPTKRRITIQHPDGTLEEVET